MNRYGLPSIPPRHVSLPLSKNPALAADCLADHRLQKPTRGALWRKGALLASQSLPKRPSCLISGIFLLPTKAFQTQTGKQRLNQKKSNQIVASNFPRAEANKVSQMMKIEIIFSGGRKTGKLHPFFLGSKRSCVFSQRLPWKSHFHWPRHKSQWLQKWIQHLRLSAMTRITTFRLNTLKIESTYIKLYKHL